MKIISRKYYWICPICGSALDPGEKCECKENRKENKNDESVVCKARHTAGSQRN